jgi:hypothetical protein
MASDDANAKLEETLRNQDVSSSELDREDKDMLEDDIK